MPPSSVSIATVRRPARRPRASRSRPATAGPTPPRTGSAPRTRAISPRRRPRRARPRPARGAANGGIRSISPVSRSPGADSGVGEQRPQERDVGVDAEQHRLGERGVEPRERLRAVGAVRDDLRDHRVVVGRDDAAGLDRGSRCARPSRRPPDAARRRSPAGSRARGSRRRRAPRSRGRSSADVVLRERERLARGDAQLLLDEVEPGDELGDRVLDLQPRVHLDEEELVRAVGGDEELDGARRRGSRRSRRPRRRPRRAARGSRRRGPATAPLR